MVKPLPLLHITFFVGALLYLVSSGLILLLPSLKMLIDGFRTQSWPAVASRINSTGIVLEHLPSGSRYCVRLTYHYRVDDVGFVGDRVCYGYDGHSEQDQARRLLLRYPLGAKVTAYYNPLDPRQSVLERGIRARVVERDLACGAFCLLTGVGMLVAFVVG
jgi:hypothetical protein